MCSTTPLARAARDRPALRWLSGFVAIVLLVPGAAYALGHYEGEAVRSGGGPLIYRESHWLYDDGGVAARVVLYLCPDGSAFARKRVRAAGANAQAPDFEMTDGRSGYVEGVRTTGGAREVFYRPRAGAEEKKAPYAADADSVADAGFDAFVRAHWDALSGTEPVTLSFLVPSRLEALGFEVRGIGDETIDGVPARRFRLELARWYGGMLPHIDVVYDTRSRQLLRYEGVSNVRSAKGRNVEVRIDFPPARRDAVAAGDADVRKALDAPLTGTCALQ